MDGCVILKKIAILGATSHIAKGLILNFTKKLECYRLFLFARNPNKVFAFCDAIKFGIDKNKVHSFDHWDQEKEHFDVLLNCVGAGTPEKVKELACGIFKLTEDFDNLCLEYLKRSPDTIYINMSSGAIYGTSFAEAVTMQSKASISVNDLKVGDFYGLAKLYTEAKHRAMASYNIVDLRVFAYFSRFIDLDGKYLITEILNAILGDRTFETTPIDIVRDYVHPDDLFFLIECCIKQVKINDAFDVYSLAPVSKFELLKHLAAKVGLKYEVEGQVRYVDATGLKNNYYSEYRKAEGIGYMPKYSSVAAIEDQIKVYLKRI